MTRGTSISQEPPIICLNHLKLRRKSDLQKPLVGVHRTRTPGDSLLVPRKTSRLWSLGFLGSSAVFAPPCALSAGFTWRFLFFSIQCDFKEWWIIASHTTYLIIYPDMTCFNHDPRYCNNNYMKIYNTTYQIWPDPRNNTLSPYIVIFANRCPDLARRRAIQSFCQRAVCLEHGEAAAAGETWALWHPCYDGYRWLSGMVWWGKPSKMDGVSWGKCHRQKWMTGGMEISSWHVGTCPN